MAYSIDDPKHPANIALSTLSSHMGEGRETWVGPTTGVHSDWCAATMVAMGISSGLAGKCFPEKNQSTPAGFQSGIACAGGVCESIVKTYGGTRYDGPAWGGSFVPTKGDLIVFLWNDFRRATISAYNAGNIKRYWSGSHVGVVEYVESQKVAGDPSKSQVKYVVHTIEGNSSNIIKKNTYAWNSECIAFYARPKWSASGGVVPSSAPTTGTYVQGSDPTDSTYTIDGTYSTQLYTTESTKADASIREVAYLGKAGKPSITISDVRLAAFNYTGLLNNLYKLQTGSLGAYLGNPDNIDGLDPKPREVVSVLVSAGYPTSAAIGIIANIEAESDFRTDCVGDHGTSFGICQWHNKRGTDMIAYVGPDWKNNLSGQVNYLIHELESDYPSLNKDLKTPPNTLAGAKQAADWMVRRFEKPADTEGASKRRQQAAERFWGKIVTGGYTEPGVSVAQTADYSNDLTVKKLPLATPVYAIWPIDSVTPGKYTSSFGYRGNIGINGASPWHSGVDIGASNGTPIKCIASGKVYRSYWNDARGWVIIIDHGNSVYTVYQHMKSKSDLAVGTQVTAGQRIGYVGNTGIGGNHLHLEVNIGGTLGMSGVEYKDTTYNCWRNHKAVDPAQYFPRLRSSA